MNGSFAKSEDGLGIHFLDNEGSDSSTLPLIIVPGMMGIAEFHENELKGLLPRRAIAITHRGLGKNFPLNAGQGSFSQRTTDIRSVVCHLSLKRYFLYGFSRGVSLSVAHTLAHPLEVAGLILHDCEPTYPKIPEKWRDNLLAAKRPHIPEQTVMAYWQASEAIDLHSRMREIGCPTLILRGEKDGSLLPLERAEAMKAALTNAQVFGLPNSAHELSELDHALFLCTLNRFMDQ